MAASVPQMAGQDAGGPDISTEGCRGFSFAVLWKIRKLPQHIRAALAGQIEEDLRALIRKAHQCSTSMRKAVRPQKSRRATDKFSSVGLGRPPFAERSVGMKVKNASTSPPVRHPTTAVQENGTYGGQGKAAGRTLAALLCVNSAFLCSRSHRAKSNCRQVWVRLTSKADDVPHTAKGANSGLDLQGCRGLIFSDETRIRYCIYSRAD